MPDPGLPVGPGLLRNQYTKACEGDQLHKDMASGSCYDFVFCPQSFSIFGRSRTSLGLLLVQEAKGMLILMPGRT